MAFWKDARDPFAAERAKEWLDTATGRLAVRCREWLASQWEKDKRNRARQAERARIKGTLWELVKFVPLMIGALLFGFGGLIVGAAVILCLSCTEPPFPLWVPWFMAIVCLGAAAIEANKFFKQWPRARRGGKSKGKAPVPGIQD